MIAALIEARLRAGVQRGLQNLVLGLAGALALAAGLGFATAAGWIVLAGAYGPLVAALCLAGGYGLVGGVLLALAARGGATQPRREARSRRDDPSRPASDDPLAQVAAAFAEGYATGRTLRGGRDS